MESPEKPYSNGHAEPEIESEPEKEPEPEIKVSKILKRPASTPSMQFIGKLIFYFKISPQDGPCLQVNC